MNYSYVLFFFSRTTWIFSEESGVLSALDSNTTRLDSNMFTFNVSQSGDVQFYETYHLDPDLPMVIKPWGLMNKDFFLVSEASKWTRRKDLTGVNIRAVYANVSTYVLFTPWFHEFLIRNSKFLKCKKYFCLDSRHKKINQAQFWIVK